MPIGCVFLKSYQVLSEIPDNMGVIDKQMQKVTQLGKLFVLKISIDQYGSKELKNCIKRLLRQLLYDTLKIFNSLPFFEKFGKVNMQLTLLQVLRL